MIGAYILNNGGSGPLNQSGSITGKVTVSSPTAQIRRYHVNEQISPYSISTQSSTPLPEKGGIIDSDHLAVGRIAAEYYLQKSYHNFAFIGYDDQLFSEIRQEGFLNTLAQEGYTSPTHLMPERPVKSHRKRLENTKSFLQKLEPPCAIFCTSDELAIQISNLCLELGKSIPEQIAILGVDNDPLLCSMASPSLSSIEPDMHRMGWCVATWMQALLDGNDPLQLNIEQVIPPRGVISRQSTSIVAMSDPLVAKAMEEIRKNACQGATVDEIAQACHVSRRTLERKFSQELDRTVKSLLTETQINRAKQLLCHTNYTLAHIAELIGMQQPEQLSHAFKRETGITPGQFRKQ